MVNKKAIAQMATREFEIMGSITVDDHGLVHVNGDVRADDSYPNKQLPLKFGKVSGNFYIRADRLNSLSGCPTEVGGHFSCADNDLASLAGAPQTVGGDFDVRFCDLKNLKGGPHTVGKNYFARQNNLESLEGIATSIGQEFDVIYNPNLGLLRALLAKEIDLLPTSFDGRFELLKILNKHAGQTPATLNRAALLCAYELTKAGFAGNARL
jgi:hypothetical protein